MENVVFVQTRLPLSGVPDVLDERGNNLENETARDSSIDVDKTNEVDNNLDESSSRALPCPDPPWYWSGVNRMES